MAASNKGNGADVGRRWTLVIQRWRVRSMDQEPTEAITEPEKTLNPIPPESFLVLNRVDSPSERSYGTIRVSWPHHAPANQLWWVAVCRGRVPKNSFSGSRVVMESLASRNHDARGYFPQTFPGLILI